MADKRFSIAVVEVDKPGEDPGARLILLAEPKDGKLQTSIEFPRLS